MVRPDELVEDGECRELEAAIQQQPRIAPEACRVARYRHHQLDLAFDQHARLHLGTGAGRIEHHRVEGFQIIGRQGRLIEIARQCLDTAGNWARLAAATSAAMAGLELSMASTRARALSGKVKVPLPA